MINKKELEKIKSELYYLFNFSKLNQEKSIEDKQIDIIINRLASAWNVDKLKIITELKIGEKIEIEHTFNKMLDKIIALQHIVEDPNYYTNKKPLNWAEKEIKSEKNNDEKINERILRIFNQKEKILSLF